MKLTGKQDGAILYWVGKHCRHPPLVCSSQPPLWIDLLIKLFDKMLAKKIQNTKY